MGALIILSLRLFYMVALVGIVKALLRQVDLTIDKAILLAVGFAETIDLRCRLLGPASDISDGSAAQR